MTAVGIHDGCPSAGMGLFRKYGPAALESVRDVMMIFKTETDVHRPR